MADQMIRAGEIDVAVAGGMESMTNAPFVLLKAREGARLGDSPMLDAMIHDGLWCAFDDRHMGEGTDAINAELGITREDQDVWAARSHARAHAAWESGRLGMEVVSVDVPSAGGPVVVARDEGIQPGYPAEGRRSPAGGVGVIHRDRRQRVADLRRGRRLVVMSEERADHLGLEPLAEVVAFGMSADRYASRRRCRRSRSSGH